MKRVVITAFMILFGTSLFADQIYLQDGSVIKGKIIQINEYDIEYKPETGRAFDVVDKSAVVKIVYDNGQAAYFAVDTLYRVDGTAVKGSVISVTKDVVIYSPQGTTEQKTVPRSEIDRIEYSDGKIVYIAKKKDAQEGPDEKIEAKKQTGGFLDSWVRIAGFMGFGSPSGGIFQREQHLFRAYQPDLFRAYVLPRDYKQYFMFVNGGGELDVMPPAIKFLQKRGFDLSGLKFGIRGRYGAESVDSTIVNDKSYYNTVEGYELFRGKLMEYQFWAVGPVMNLVFSPRSNLFNFLVNFYLLGGQVFQGNLKGAAALRSAHWLAPELIGAYGPPGPFINDWRAVFATRYLNRTRFGGYTIRMGLGPHFSLNKYFPIIFGFNITYAYSNFTFNRAPVAYFDGHKKASQHEVGAEVTAGVHF
jgi:hypothetical protein